MEKQPLISVIMPVYNSEKYMKKTITSILDQSLKNIELILVDDCSTDSSISIAKKFEKNDARVRVILQEKNSGPGAAKNKGISVAKGTYLTFCDADDWIESDMYKVLFDNIEYYRGDVAICGIVQEFLDVNEKIIYCKNAFLVNQFINGELEAVKIIPELDRAKVFAYAWNKLFKNTIVSQYNIKFSDKKFGEDYDFVIGYFKHVNSIVMCKNTYYHYVKRNRNSLSEGYISNYFEIISDRYSKMCKLLINKSAYLGKVRSQAATIHLKHVLAAIVQLNYHENNLNWSGKLDAMRRIYDNSYTKQALRYAKAENKFEFICNSIVKIKIYSLELILSKLILLIQNKR